MLPEALASGLPRAWPPKDLSWSLAALPVAVLVAVSAAARAGRRDLAVGLLALASAAGLTHLKWVVYPQLDAAAGTPRPLQEALATKADQICLGEVRRHVAYGVGFYGSHRVIVCSEQTRPLRLEGDPPTIVSIRQLP